MPNFTAEKKYVYRLVQKVILVYIANVALYDNCVCVCGVCVGVGGGTQSR